MTQQLILQTDKDETKNILITKPMSSYHFGGIDELFTFLKPSKGCGIIFIKSFTCTAANCKLTTEFSRSRNSL